MNYSRHKNFLGSVSRSDVSPISPLVSTEAVDSTMAPGFDTEIQRYFSKIDSFPAMETAGILIGEFLVMDNGFFLIDRSGTDIFINLSDQDFLLTNRLFFETCQNEQYRAVKRHLLAQWDSYPCFEGPAVLMATNHNNYYHFTMDFLPRFRLLDRLDCADILLPTHCGSSRPFQSELLLRASGGRRLVSFNWPQRVRNPRLVWGDASRGGMLWLRTLLGVADAPTGKRYYVRRVTGPLDQRPVSGKLAETPEVMQVLEDFGFETISFGSGEYSVAAQIDRLAGASMVVGSHGAHLTNLVYASPSCAVLEIFRTTHLGYQYAAIAASLGMPYRAMISATHDEQGDIVISPNALRESLVSLGG